MIKFLDLKTQYQSIKEEMDCAILEVLQNGAFVGGEFVSAFEREFALRVGSDFALGVGNGTDAIEIALRALELKEGSEVILPANTFFGSLEGVVNAGLKPVFVDCGEDYCIDVSKIRTSITPKTSAILPVHLYGRMCNMEEILKIAQEFNLKVIEDCAQSFGAEVEVFGKTKKAGSIGDIGCFSFYPGKNLGAYGDGGAITTSDQKLFELCASLANHGRGKDKYEHLRIGRNSRLDAIQARVLSVKLKYIDDWNAKRQEVAKHYNTLLQEIPSLVLPSFDESLRSVWHLYVVRLEGKNRGRREELMQYLQNNGVEVGIHYPLPLDCNPNFRATHWSKDILSLPMGEHLGFEEVEKIVKIIANFLGKI